MTKKLKNAKVFRVGKTARTDPTLETTHVFLETFYEDLKWNLRFKFDIASKGGGQTVVELRIGPDDFSDLALAIMRVNRQTAMQVMADTLAKEIGNQPVLDRATRETGRVSVIEAAQHACSVAPSDRNHAEKLTYDMVQIIVEKLNEEDKKSAF